MKRNWLLWADMGMTVGTLACFWYRLEEAEQWLSFAGFGALFMMLFYGVLLGLLALGGVLLALFIRKRRRGLLVAASVFQGLTGLLYFRLWTAIPSLWTWTETALAALEVLVVMELVAEWTKPAR